MCNVYNTIFCSHCGFYLVKDENRETDPLEVKEFKEANGSEMSSDVVKTTSTNTQLRTIRLKIGKRGQEFEIPLNRAIHLGRLDPAADIFPEGTFINGKILAPYLPQPLKNGDIIQLGQLPIEVYFPH